MNGQNFNVFKEMFKVYKKYPVEQPKFHDKFVFNIEEGLKNSKIFEVDDDIKKLLILSKPPQVNSDLKLPFNEFFIDVQFDAEDLQELGMNENVFGILVRKGNYFYEDGKIAGNDLRISVCIVDNQETRFNTSSVPFDFTKENYKELNMGLQKGDISKFIERFVLCFINLLTFRDVETIEVVRSEKGNLHRVKRGKSPLPTTTKILVVGTIKKYIDETKGLGKWSFNYSFWVVGHFRRLESERYHEKKRIWIMPYLKCEGKEEIKKVYRVYSNDKTKLKEKTDGQN
jgi:hypothetical protein